MIYTITPDCDGITVREYLRRELGLSRASVTRLKTRERGILLCGERVTVRAVLRAGDTLELDEEDGEDEVNEYLEPVELPFEPLYEDADLLAVNKPAGMPTHPSHGHWRDTLANAAAFYFAGRGKPFVFRAVNRLDSGTSGVVLLAKNKRAAYILGKSASPDGGRGGSVIKKEYFAVLRGIINPAEPLRGVTYIAERGNFDVARHAGVEHTGGRSGSRHAINDNEAVTVFDADGTFCTDSAVAASVAPVADGAITAPDAPVADGAVAAPDVCAAGGTLRGVIDAPIRRALPDIILREVAFDADAAHALTEFEIVATCSGGRFGPLTLVRAFPRTGRTHQLRVHFAYLGCPIAGDTLYGRYAAEFEQPIGRQALHCAAMTVDGRRIESPLPEDILSLINIDIYRKF